MFKKLLIMVGCSLFLSTSSPEAKVFKEDKEVDLEISNRIIFLNEPITPELIKPAKTKLMELDLLSSEPIFIFINSPGGYVSTGFEFIDTMSHINSKTVCVVTGGAYSMAANILSACDVAYGSENSTYLIHDVLISIPYANIGQAEKIVKRARWYNNRLLDFVSKKLEYDRNYLAEISEKGEMFPLSTAIEINLIDHRLGKLSCRNANECVPAFADEDETDNILRRLLEGVTGKKEEIPNDKNIIGVPSTPIKGKPDDLKN